MASSKVSVKYKTLNSHSRQILSRSDYISSWQRYNIFVSLLLPIMASVLVAAASLWQWRLEGKASAFITSNRATTQIIVQLVAGALGTLDMAVVQKLINFAARENIGRRQTSLDELSFMSAVSNKSFTLSLRSRHLTLLILFLASATLPAALWVGALTPTEALVIREEMRVMVPAYSLKTAHYWNKTRFLYNGFTNQSAEGSFSYASPLNRFSYFYADGAAASSIDGSPRLHAKSDNSNFTYIGRSYGAGGLVGLRGNGSLGPTLAQGLLEYVYYELGWLPNVTCSYNASTDYGFRLSYQSTAPGIPSTYYAHTNRSTDQGGYTNITVFGFGEPHYNVAVGGWSPPSNTTWPVFWSVIAAGPVYKPLNATQCLTTFTPARFQVKVDLRRNLISVRLNSTHNVTNIDETWTIPSLAANSLSLMSIIDNSYLASIVGDMLMNNIENVKLQHSNETNAQTNLRGIKESFETVIENTLIQCGAAQLMIANDYSYQPVVAYARAFKIGQEVYIDTTALLHCLLLVSVCIECFRRTGWRYVPRFDITDAKSVAVAASIGGRAIADAVEHRYTLVDKTARKRSAWNGDAEDRVAGGVSVMLERNEDGFGLRPKFDGAADNERPLGYMSNASAGSESSLLQPDPYSRPMIRRKPVPVRHGIPRYLEPKVSDENEMDEPVELETSMVQTRTWDSVAPVLDFLGVDK